MLCVRPTRVFSNGSIPHQWMSITNTRPFANQINMWFCNYTALDLECVFVFRRFFLTAVVQVQLYAGQKWFCAEVRNTFVCCGYLPNMFTANTVNWNCVNKWNKSMKCVKPINMGFLTRVSRYYLEVQPYLWWCLTDICLDFNQHVFSKRVCIVLTA